ncbi:MAG: M20/M25/M40 family metallo-hydrolase [Thiotrichales bacterium]|nr:MAG: M20/M25/M40 family metallo-hydrolase [Thiotrichales bacterium]
MTTTDRSGSGKMHGVRVALVLLFVAIVAVIIAGGWFIMFMPGKSWSDPVPPLSAEEQQIHDRLKHHVEALAGRIGERNVWNAEALAAAALYIHNSLEESGYAVRVQAYESRGMTVQNLEVELPGASAAEEVVVVGAHYDSIAGGPGGNDNASGVAALLEIARLLANANPSRTLRLVAFVNEEQPFSYSEEMGSRVYAERARASGQQITAMVSLETIGYYSDQPGSQHYPFPFSLFYPDTGNFLGFVGNLSSWRLVRQAIAAFRASTAFPSEGVAAPEQITGVGWSDHWPFWRAGYPAIMVTDTAFFRYPHYHKATDTPDKLDYLSLARVTRGLVDVVAELAGKPLDSGFRGND